jgi:hypothetical protein
LQPDCFGTGRAALIATAKMAIKPSPLSAEHSKYLKAWISFAFSFMEHSGISREAEDENVTAPVLKLLWNRFSTTQKAVTVASHIFGWFLNTPEGGCTLAKCHDFNQSVW